MADEQAKILIVEPNDDLRSMLTLYLAHHTEYTIIPSNSVDDTLTLIADHKPDVVIIDADLPLSQLIKTPIFDTVERLEDPAAIWLVSLEPESGGFNMMGDFGIHMTKPFDVEELTRNIENRLRWIQQYFRE